jgi:4'-phosphopantetheinyl transferase EntD
MSPSEPDDSHAQHSRPVSAERRASGVVEVRSFDLGWNDDAIPAAVLVTYDIDGFDLAAFARHGIDMPASIGRSVRKRQGEFFMGRLAASDAVAALVRGDRENLSPMNRLLQERGIGIGESREPVWPAGMIGSISHAGRYAGAVVASAGDIAGIGIDIECRIGTETRESVEGAVLNATEQALLRALGGDLPYEMLLTVVFSAKESFFKGCFATVGNYFDFAAVELTALDVVAGTLELKLTQTLAPSLPQGQRFTLRNRFVDADTVFTSFVLARRL